MQVQRTVSVPEADYSHGPQAKKVRGTNQHPTGVGNGVAGRLDRVEIVFDATEVGVHVVAVLHAASYGSTGRVCA